MTTQSEQAPDKIELVTAQEQLVLEKIARGYGSHSQLAIALSVLNEGSTHGQATEKKTVCRQVRSNTGQRSSEY